MLKRSIATIQQWFSPEPTSPDPRSGQNGKVCVSRRVFFKRAAVGAASITGTAGLAKVVVDSVPQPDLQDRYRTDALTGEQELMQREYVLMSDQEKADMVQTFVDDYSNQV